jgi:hypothetical protein
MCPVCTVTVIAGLGLSRLLGIDDVVISLWIGAFILSFSFITIDWIEKKWPKLKIKRFSIPVIVLMYLLVLVPLKMNGSIGLPGNILWGIDKIVLGVIIGSIVFLFGAWTDKKERKIKGKQLFKFQKVVFPVIALILASVVGFILTA